MTDTTTGTAPGTVPATALETTSETAPEATSETAVTAKVEVLVCTRCRIVGTERTEAGGTRPRPGSTLHEALASRLPDGVSLRGVECLSNCSDGCTLAFRGPGRWSYVYGGVDPGRDLEAVIDGLTRYLASRDGIVPWRERPEHFRRHCVARLPPETLPETARAGDLS